MKFLNYQTWHSKKLKDVFFPILVINWITGLNIVEIPVGHRRPILSFIYLMIMIIFYYYIPFSKGLSICRTEGHVVGQMLFEIIWFYNGFVGLISIMIGWYYQKVVRLCIQRIELIDASLDSFGLENNHGKSFVRLVLTLIVTFSGIFLVVATDVFWFLKEHSLEDSIYCAYTSSAPVFLQIIIDLSFGTMVTHQHLELSKVAWEVEKVFGLQIAMSMVTNITFIIGNSYYLYNEIFNDDSVEESEARLGYIANEFCCCFLYLSRVLYVNDTCARVTAYAHKAEQLIYSANRSNHDTELREEIEQFSLQLTQRPLYFSMYGLTTLDYGFVAKFLGTIMTYLIIIIQIEPKPSGNVTDTTTEVYTNLTTPIF
ncbi:putative gustatory receptor 28b [Belonocnema kinseyi]|uniref:putative gustatory receptor 28b n=1 Tax=Belonocnema kinseyi TaxID=2817044 RepID=UPI00143DE8D8|nr:putative gustatory receptor 28b [Belonocnema kinseyi]